MDQKEFLARVLPSGNHYIAYPSDRKDGRGKPIWNHRPFTELGAGVAIADQTASQSKDVYFAVASYKQARVWDEKLGKEKSYRKQENVAELKCLFLDVDYKSYDSPEETVNALERFLSASKLERPSIIVVTGGGLHVYWTFPHAIPLEEWQPLANGLAGIAENLGLRADLQCTIDSARILRMPGTRNFKYDPPLFCEVVVSRSADVDLEELTKRLHGVTSIRARTGRTTSKPIAFTVDPAVTEMFPDPGDDLGAGVGYTESSIAQMVKAGGCPLIADMLARGGNGDSRDLWNNMLLLAAYTTDGTSMVHMLSSGDPRYTAAETDAEFAMKLADKDKLGPTTCDTFARLSIHCATCPHRGKITSPIVLGRQPAEVTPLNAEPSFIENGATWSMLTRTQGSETETIKLRLFDMELDRPVLIDIEGDAKLELTFRRAGQRTRKILVDCGKIGSRDYLPSTLGGHAIMLPKELQKPVETVLMAWTSLLRNTASFTAPPFGWSDKGFSLNGNLYTLDGNVHRVGSGSTNDDYGATGDPDVWQELAEHIIADPATELQIMLASAFAAPLMEFTEIPATSLVIRSRASGAGKTSVLRIAQATYANPEKAMSHASDTPMAVSTKLAHLSNMPWYWDEVRIDNSLALSNAVYQVLQGRSKARGRPDGDLRATYVTHGMLVMATNLSIQEIMQEASRGTDAGSYRILELDMSNAGPRAADPHFNLLMNRLRNNYGHAGEAYARYIATHRDEVESIVEKISASVDSTFASERVERYWMSAVKTLIAGAIIATKAGVCTFDVVRISSFLQKAITGTRSRTTTVESPAELAGRIWRYYANKSLITDDFPMGGPGVPRPVIMEPPLVTQQGLARVRLAYATNKLLLSVDGIRDYAKAMRQQPELICESIASISTHLRTSIDKGIAKTGSRSGREQIYVMQASDVLGQDEINQWITSAAARHAASHGSSSGSAPSGSTAP